MLILYYHTNFPWKHVTHKILFGSERQLDGYKITGRIQTIKFLARAKQFEQ